MRPTINRDQKTRHQKTLKSRKLVRSRNACHYLEVGSLSAYKTHLSRKFHENLLKLDAKNFRYAVKNVTLCEKFTKKF